MKNGINSNHNLFTAVTAEFDLAALMGRNVGQKQCDTIYARCPYQTKDLMAVMRQTNIPYHNQY